MDERGIKKLRNSVKRKVSLYALNCLIKEGYSANGTDAIVMGSDVWGEWWWPVVRDAVLWRDGQQCKICSGAGTAVHHILPRYRGGSDNPINLLTVCDRCHKMIHKKRGLESVDAVKRYIQHQSTLDVYIEVIV